MGTFATKKSAGLTLVELVIVMTIVVVLATTFLMNYLAQIRKANDGRRRRDLYELQRAMEDYYNDNGCYPQGEDLLKLQHCDSHDFRPWLNSVPCDPRSHQPYKIIVEDDSCPSWFSIYTNLFYPRKGDYCHQGCQIDGRRYTLGVASPNITPPEQVGSAIGSPAPSVTPSPTSPLVELTPTPTPAPTSPSGCYPATCGEEGSRYCLPNTCSTCCPGVEYRCNSEGTECCYDVSCGQ